MTNEQILKKAIEKAEESGLKIENLDCKNETELSWFCDMVIADSLYNLIFSHDFAKAFWERYWRNYFKRVLWDYLLPQLC